jgi:hypothetical protein
MSFLLYSKPHALVSMLSSAVLTYPNPLLSKADWCRYCINLRTLNLSCFKVIEAMGLSYLSYQSWTLSYCIKVHIMASPPYNIHPNLQINPKVLRWGGGGNTDTLKTDRLVIL